MISIVIPVYNVEKYLKDCMESVLAQTCTDFEVILVDDGSTDGCPGICDAYAAQDARVQVIHKANGGLSDARNAGTEKAAGEWILYLDSDDYLEKNALETLAKLQQEYQSDIVISNYSYLYDDHEDIAETQYRMTTEFDNPSAMEALITGKIQNFAWGKLIRTDVAKQHSFPKGKIFEDHYWTHEVFAEADTLVFCPVSLIHYRQRNNSISYTMNLERLDILDGWSVRTEFLEKNYPDLVIEYKEFTAKQFLALAWLVMTRIRGKEKKMAVRRMISYLDNHDYMGIQNLKTISLLNTFKGNRLVFAILYLLNR